jgi:hypothetical protein
MFKKGRAHGSQPVGLKPGALSRRRLHFLFVNIVFFFVTTTICKIKVKKLGGGGLPLGFPQFTRPGTSLETVYIDEN